MSNILSVSLSDCSLCACREVCFKKEQVEERVDILNEMIDAYQQGLEIPKVIFSATFCCEDFIPKEDVQEEQTGLPMYLGKLE